MKTLLLAVSLALLLFTGAGNSTTVVRMSFSEVIDAAETIALGTVMATESVWSDDRQLPFTEVSFQIEETVKGEVGTVLVLRFLGGPAPNGLTLEVSDMPTFAVGQRVVLFAAEDTDRACPLVGWWQGLYRINRDRQGFDTVTDHAGRPVVEIAGAPGRREARLPAGEAPYDAVTIGEFVASIRQEL